MFRELFICSSWETKNNLVENFTLITLKQSSEMSYIFKASWGRGREMKERSCKKLINEKICYDNKKWILMKLLSANVPLEEVSVTHTIIGKNGEISKRKQKGFNTLYCFVCLISLWTHRKTGITKRSSEKGNAEGKWVHFVGEWS